MHAPDARTDGGQAARHAGALVRVHTPEGLTPGFVPAPGGRVATSLRALRGASSCRVQGADGRAHDAEGVETADAGLDVAVLRVPEVAPRALPLAGPGLLPPGTRLWAAWLVGPERAELVPARVRAHRKGLGALPLYVLEGLWGGLPAGAPLLDTGGRVAALLVEEGPDAAGSRPEAGVGVPATVLAPLLARHEATALAALPPPLPTPGAGRVRQVPQHRPELLEGCSAQQLVKVAATLAGAIRVGAPAYNEGDADTCYQVYARAARGLLADVPPGSGVQRALVRGLQRARALTDAQAQAWAMRDAFDGLLDVIGRKLGAPAGRLGLLN